MHPLYTYIRQSLSPFYTDSEAQVLAKSILSEIFGFSVSELYAGKDMNFPADAHAELESILDRLKRHEPFQYIAGRTSFHGLSFRVTPDVLIPRPETAELVDWIVTDRQGRYNGLHIVDIGTGSGCIAISLARMCPGSCVSAWDISASALSVAKQNAKENRVSISFKQVDILSDICPKDRADILVSNPPYIPEHEKGTLDPNVRDWEPDLALFVSDNDPLLFFREIAKKGRVLLDEGGVIYFEIHQAYGQETADLLSHMGYRDVELRKDMSGNDRMIKALRP